MVPGVLGRGAELAAIDEVLASSRLQPTALSIRGEAGVGKSTLLQAAVNLAGERGFTVLSCAPDSTETALSYASLADAFGTVTERLPDLPEPQRFALEAALLRRTRADGAADVRAVYAGTLSLLAACAAEQPVLIAIDDVPWLDESSARALAFALRRCRNAFGLITTMRDGLELRLPDLVTPTGGAHDHSIQVRGLALAPLHELLAQQVGPINRPTMQHIAAVSRGNPLFAQELARRLRHPDGKPLPSALSTGMHLRIDALPAATRDALLICSAVRLKAAPVMNRAGVPDAASTLAPAENSGIITWSGGQIRFTHPMWREIVYQMASPVERRDAHRRLSMTVDDVEERARHLALSSPQLEPSTTAALLEAATAARSRGAPAQAAELLDLALDRGATEPNLRLQAATDHLASGRPEQARAYAQALVDELPACTGRAAALSLLGEITFVVDDFPAAIDFLEQAYADANDAPAIQVTAAIDLAFAHANLGSYAEGLVWALRGETCAADADDPALAAEAIGAAAVMEFLTGAGVDQIRIDHALEDEDVTRVSSPVRWPSTSVGLIRLWSYDLERAGEMLAAVRQRCTDHGLERGLFLLLPRLAEAALQRGDVESATTYAAELDERAAMGAGESVRAAALAWRVVVAARSGVVQDAEVAYRALTEIVKDDRHVLANLVAVAALGTCQLAAGRVEEAAASLEPVGMAVLALGLGEPVISPFFADCIDVAAATGRLDRATALVQLLERWSERSGTRWPRGIGARGRAVLELHHDDLDAATSAIHQALAALDTPGLDYERARTLLIAARIQRRRRQRGQAQVSLRAASAVFLRLGALGWAAHADRELARLGLKAGREKDLTPSERLIAELAAAGHTNAAVASRLAVSPKTVEAHLSHIYRKLGIRSRAELGRWAATELKPSA